MKRFLALIVAASGAVHGIPRTCPMLSRGHTLRARTSTDGPACFALTVKDGDATQLSVEQPVDLTIRTSNSTTDALTDGFDFGKETVTILVAGQYLIEVKPVVGSAGSGWNFSVSRRELPLELAQSWQRAESFATESKRSEKSEDIAGSLQLWKEVNDASAIARTLLEQGDAFRKTSDLLAARGAYEDALRICQSLDDFRCTAEAANNSGDTAFLLGDFATAEQRLREATAYWRRIASPLYAGRTLSNMGLMFWQSGDFEKSIQALDEARRILRRRDPQAHARVLNNLGLYYQSLSENDKALAYFQSAWADFRAHHQPAVRVLLNLGRSYMLLGKLERAKVTLERALAESAEIPEPAARADVLNNLGQALLKLHRGEQARARLMEALIIQRQVHAKRGEAIALHYLGVEASERGDTEAARQLLGQAAQIRRDSGLRDDASESVFALAELEYRAGNLVDARDLVSQAIASIESVRSTVPSAALRATYYGRKRRFFDLLVDIAMTPANPAYAAEGFLVAEQNRGRSLLDLLRRGGIAGEIPRELFVRRNNLGQQIGFFSLRLTDADPSRANDDTRSQLEGDRANLRRRIELLLSEYDQVEAEIRRTVDASALRHPLASVSQLGAAVAGDSAVLEYYLGERQSYLWVIQAGRVQSFSLPSRTVIEQLAKRTADRFGAIMDRRRSPQAQNAFDADVRRLSFVLLGPLAGLHLPQRLILVLDGALNRVPMAALRPSWAREALGLTFDIIQAPSAAYLIAAKPPRRVSAFPRSILAIADPVFATDDPRFAAAPAHAAGALNLPRLPFNAELATLTSLLSPSRILILRGFDATPQSLLKIDMEEFAVLHISSHAFIDDRIPELSYVALSLVDRAGRTVDGYLHSYQFADFRLNRSIVVLASCETALGKEVLGEGLIGFANSLFSAGASQLVLTLTKVDAESSASFFSEAYRHFFSVQPIGMEHALTLARRTMARSTRWADPYYWAPFTVIGSPSSASGR